VERSHKSWGEKWNLIKSDSSEVSFLDLKSWQRCSWHRHQCKFNLFFVIDGEIFIKTDSGLSKVAKNEIFTTRPGEWHEFQTHELPARIIEVMYVQYQAEDIERKELGGGLEHPENEVKFFSVCSQCGCSYSYVDRVGVCPLCKEKT
jgi:mannose-6-phosphate isomerase-like protein (cupin superfamily)